MDQIHSTNDYNQFKKIRGNCHIKEAHVKSLIDSISKKNLLSENPILVTRNMEVIDGQHRLEAAKRRSWEIYYIISKVDKEAQNGILNDIHLLQTQRTWTSQDFLESYITKGVQSYIYLKQFMKKYDLTLNVAILLLANPKIEKVSDIMLTFKRGSFVALNFKEAEFLAQNLLELRPFIEERVRRDREFMRALKIVYNKITPKELLNKLIYSKEKIRPQATVREYLRTLEEIYNFRHKIRVTFF